MPSCIINTNVLKSELPNDFSKNLADVVASTLGKPKEVVCITVRPELEMFWNGSSAPCCEVFIGTVGNVGKEVNAKHTKSISEFLQGELKLSNERVHIFYQDFPPEMVGWKGKTILELRS